jgi:hypothetical protein
MEAILEAAHAFHSKISIFKGKPLVFDGLQRKASSALQAFVNYLINKKWCFLLIDNV